MLEFINKPILYISNTAYLKMQEYIKQSDKEIGWLGGCTRQDNDYYLYDVYLFNQEVNHTTCEITEEGLNNFAMELMKQKNGIEIWNSLSFWGHSHVNMGTSPSAQDDSQLQFFLKNMSEGFFIRYIGNKKNEINIKIVDLDKNVIITGIDTKIVMKQEEIDKINTLESQIKELEKQISQIKSCPDVLKLNIKNEIKEKVKEIKYKYPVYKYGNTQASAQVQKDKEYLDKAYGRGLYGYNYNNWCTDYDDYWDEYEEYTILNNKQDHSYNDYKNANEIFDELTQEEIFEIEILIDAGKDYKDLLSNELLNKLKGSEDIFEELVEDYIWGSSSVTKKYKKYCKEVAL